MTSTRLLSHANGTRQYSPPGTGDPADGRTARPIALLPPLAAWMDDPRRKCRGKPTAWWYGPGEDELGTTPADAAEAERLCRICPLNLDCTEYGLRNERHGRWGRVKLPMNASNRNIELAAVARERKRRTA